MDLESAKRRLQSGDSETRELIECAIDQSREAQALTNVAKHSNASECRLSARAGEGVLTVEVHDNGRCGAHIGKGTGLAGLQDRLAGVDAPARRRHHRCADAAVVLG
ncbi:hypothetical protein [Arthrobacter sp. Soil782]|uniref:hypothetical protein n=1 Tax=Arthrobacter sp. Soil782 TaxID=1736410 RepID=UPI001F41FA2A|nr:hypothetical protein [Arthrobacter sp. Soil782]